MDLQAMARVWRDGQQKPCVIYRLLLTGGTGVGRHVPPAADGRAGVGSMTAGARLSACHGPLLPACGAAACLPAAEPVALLADSPICRHGG